MSEATRARLNAQVIVHTAGIRGKGIDVNVPFNVPRENLPSVDNRYLDILLEEAAKVGLGYLGRDGVDFSFQRTQNR